LILQKKILCPDFIFYDPVSKLKIDIEIDEPYVLTTGEPIHYDYCEYPKEHTAYSGYKSIDAIAT